MDVIFSRKKSITPLLIIITILILASVFTFSISVLNPTTEHFYTLFTPYYYPDAIDKIRRFKNNYPWDSIAKPISLQITVTNQQRKNTNLHLFLKSLIAYKDPIIRVKFLADMDDEWRIIDKLMNLPGSQIGIISAPILASVIVPTSPAKNNLRFIAKWNQQAVFILTKINRGNDTLIDLAPRQKRWGLDAPHSLWNKIADDVAFASGMSMTRRIFNPMDINLRALDDGSIDAILLTDVFPSNILNYIFYNFLDLQLVSFTPNFATTGQNKPMDYYYHPAKLDLNQLVAGFTPRATWYGKHRNYFMNSPLDDNNHIRWANKVATATRGMPQYNPYNSTFYTYTFANHFITNVNLPDETCRLFIEHIYNNAPLLGKKIQENNFADIPIVIHQAATEFYRRRGFTSEIDSDKCRYFYSKSECTAKAIRDNQNNMN